MSGGLSDLIGRRYLKVILNVGYACIYCRIYSVLYHNVKKQQLPGKNMFWYVILTQTAASQGGMAVV